MKLEKLSPAALKAAMIGGTEQWGERASIFEHVMYVEPQDARGRWLLKCRCGCERKATHRVMANGICMGEMCELSAHRHARLAVA